MKKVLFTATVDSHIENFHIPYLKYFKEQGYEVHVATNGDDEIPYCDKKIKISFERSPFKLNNLKAIKQLKKVIMEEKYDIIHTHTPMGSVVTRLAAAKARKKYHTRVIYTAHGFHFYKGAPKKNWLLFYPVEKILSKITDTLITINNEDYELAKNKFWCKDVQYVPGVGIDEKKFNIKMTKKEKTELRKSLGLKEDDFVMIYVARLDKNKNQGFLIEVTRELIKTNPNVHLLLVGPDEYNGKYQEQAKDILSNVHFTGLRKDIPELLNISDVAVSSSLREGLPVNIMEALTVGLPVVATDARGVRDLVQDGVNGYVVEKGNIKQFIFYINSLEKLKKDNYSNTFCLNSILKKYKKIYNKKKKVLHVLSSDRFSGAENVACTIIENMLNDYDMVYCSLRGPIENTLKEKNIKYYGLEKLNIKGLKEVIKLYKPDIIHAHDFKASFVCSHFYRKSRIISHIHKNDPKMRTISIKSVLYKVLNYRFYKIVGVSDSILDEYIFNKSIIKKYLTINNYVDKEKIIQLSNEFKVNKKYDLFFFGRLSEEKNPLMFIEIIKKLKDKTIRSIIIGDGPLYNECKKKIKEYHLEKNIEMVGFKSNPFPFIKASKIGIMPSKFEGFGLTAIETIILGKPILNSGVGGLKEIFKNNSNLICHSVEDYFKKYNEKKIKLDNFNFLVSLEEWKSKINKIYN